MNLQCLITFWTAIFFSLCGGKNCYPIKKLQESETWKQKKWAKNQVARFNQLEDRFFSSFIDHV